MKWSTPAGAGWIASLLLVALAPPPTVASSLLSPLHAQAAGVPAPSQVLGFEVGADRTLADWGQVLGYLTAASAASPRVRMDTLGTTTLGRPFVMLTVSSPANLDRLERLREVQLRLSDPRGIGSAGEAEALVREGRAVVLITSAIHSTEVGATQVPMRILHRLAASDDPAVLRILDEVILLLIPSLNPDGVDLVVDWYRRTLGHPWEGASPPFLYHHYVGHDNNRDWYAFTQAETRLAIEHAHNAWHPQIVHDIHQQSPRGARFFIPPWIDPIEPNVDPLITQATNDLGTHMAWRMGTEGKRGIVVNATYDAWTPARAYQHYHGGVRVLTETASANMATPMVIGPEELGPGRNFDASEPSWNFPDPWPGGEWRLSDILDYMESGAFALLEHAAANRELWLRNFHRINRRAVDGWERWPEAWVIPAEPLDSDDDEGRPSLRAAWHRAGLSQLLRILTTGDVEVHRAEAPFTVLELGERVPGTPAEGGGGAAAEGAGHGAGLARGYPAGSYVIPMRQPYASFAQAMLERQDYPDLRLYPEGPPRRPYDVTAHTLPLLLGVAAVPAATLEGGLDGLALSPPIEVHADPRAVREVAGLPRWAEPLPRIALYQSHAAAMDEGWTRWVLETYGVPYTTVRDAELRAGGLAGRYDVLLFASEPPRTIREGRARDSIFPEYTGGLGEAGASAVADFVRGGGALVALEQSSGFAIDALGLPLRDRLEGLPERDFYIPGSILRLDVEPATAAAAGVPASTIAWFQTTSLAFDGTERPDVRVLARYGERPLLSGWALGGDRVAGAAAAAEVRVGEGRAVLFGFRPQYRGQPVATFPLLFHALGLRLAD